MPLVKNPVKETSETQVQSLGWEDTLEESMATHSNIPTYRSSVDRGSWPATVHVVAKSLTQLKHLGTHAPVPLERDYLQ